jgi:acyl-[acyl-carrier-protein] desaturase
MEIILDQPHNRAKHELLEKVEVLREIEPIAEALMATHLEKRRLWFSTDFLPADEQLTDEEDAHFLARLRERARGISDAIRVSVCVNLLTEEGLPHFHRLISKYMGDESVWGRWNFMWTAEEDRHGAVLRDYARDTRLFKFSVVEKMQYAYQEAGFTPDWDKDPYRVFVYTTLQERATQYSHRNTGRLVGDEEPLLKGVLLAAAADEAKHFAFYRQVFEAILKVDPNQALQSALHIMPSIDMPGFKMPHFRDMADIIRRMGIYGPWEYKEIVEEAIDFWKLETLTGLNEMGRKAQDKILAIPARLKQVAEYVERRTVSKTFSFPFIYERILSFE